MKKCDIRNTASPFPIFITDLDSWSEVKSLEIPTRYFTLFLAADYTTLNSVEMSEIAIRMIDIGLRYVSCWGVQSTLGDNAFDMGNILWAEQNDTDLHVMTTWHDEPLADALWFWLYNRTPDDKYWNQCSAVVVNVSKTASSNQLERLIVDPEYLNHAVNDV